MEIFTQSLAALAIGIVSAAVVAILSRTERNRGTSMSEHIGRKRSTYLLFAWAATGNVLLLGTFIWTWLVPHLQLPLAFQVMSALVLVGELGVAWARYIPKDGWDVHSVFAYAMAMLMPLMLSFLWFANLSAVAKVVVGLAIGWMIFALCLMFVPNIKRLYLPLQMSYMASFCAAILVVAYF